MLGHNWPHNVQYMNYAQIGLLAIGVNRRGFKMTTIPSSEMPTPITSKVIFNFMILCGHGIATSNDPT